MHKKATFCIVYLEMFQQIIRPRMAQELRSKETGLNVGTSLIRHPVSDVQVELFVFCGSVHALVEHYYKCVLIYLRDQLRFNVGR